MCRVWPTVFDGKEDGGRLLFASGVEWMMLDDLDVLGFLSFFVRTFAEGGGVSLGD